MRIPKEKEKFKMRKVNKNPKVHEWKKWKRVKVQE